jgi:hypothetical protein
MPSRGSVVTGIGLGAALMYWLDPQRGRRRRALLRDQLAHAAHVGGDALGATSRDLAHRTYGTTAQLGGRWFREDVDDDRLVARVRSRLGRVVSHPHAIDVSTRDGTVTVRGPILQAELPRLLQTIGTVRGVRNVVNELEEHKQAGNVPGLQGGSTPPGLRPDVLQRNWSPATRFLAGAGGMALTTYGAARRDMPGALLAAGGVGLLARAVTNVDSGRLTGLRGTRRAVDIQKTITIEAPVEAVFAFWTAYENFPRFMSRVLDVRASSRRTVTLEGGRTGRRSGRIRRGGDADDSEPGVRVANRRRCDGRTCRDHPLRTDT